MVTTEAVSCAVLSPGTGVGFEKYKHLAGGHSCLDISIPQYLAGTLDGELQKVLAFYGEKAADIEKELRDLERELPQLKPGHLESVEEEQVLTYTSWARSQALCSSCRLQVSDWADAACLAVQHAAAAWH